MFRRRDPQHTGVVAALAALLRNRGQASDEVGATVWLRA